MPIVASGSTVVYMDPANSVFKSEAVEFNMEDNSDLITNNADFDCFKRIGSKYWNEGSTQGSLFKFTLRQIHEDHSFSSICYDNPTFEGLMEKFLNEAYLALIFLKHVKSLKMYVIEEGRSDLKEVFRIVATDSVKNTFSEVVTKRVLEKDFSNIEKLSHQIDLSQNFNGDIKHFTYVVSEHFGYKGDNEKFKQMMVDEELSYVPLVSVALPIQGEDPGGHLFSALPLPLQIKCMTGIPAHINGFFALGQDRKDLKWKTLTETSESNDKTVGWNQCLIKEIVPLVYMDLIKFLEESYTSDEVYMAWPCKKTVDNKWHIFLNEFYNLMSKVKFIYNHLSKGYLKVDEVCFINPERFSTEDQKSAVSQFTELCSCLIAEVPLKLTNSFNDSLLHWVDSTKVLKMLQEGPQYFASLVPTQQSMVLEYAINSSADWSVLATTPIFKLVNGTCVSLSSCTTYLAKDEEMCNLIPSKDQLLDVSMFVDVGGSNQLITSFESYIKEG